MDNKRPGLRGVRAGCLTVQFSVIGWFLSLGIKESNPDHFPASRRNDEATPGLSFLTPLHLGSFPQTSP